jgi:hypothetical protein
MGVDTSIYRARNGSFAAKLKKKDTTDGWMANLVFGLSANCVVSDSRTGGNSGPISGA